MRRTVRALEMALRPARAIPPWLPLVGLSIVGCTQTTVQPVGVDRVTVIPESVVATVSEQAELTAEVRDQDGNLLPDRQVAWSSLVPEIVTVDQAGLMTAVSPGQALVTATTSGVVGLAQVTVTAKGIDRLLGPLEPDSVDFRVRQTRKKPDWKDVLVRSEGNRAVTGLRVSVAYHVGGGWLQTTLSNDRTPATLAIRPSRTDLPLGGYSATVTVQSSGGGSRSVIVTYRVRDKNDT